MTRHAAPNVDFLLKPSGIAGIGVFAARAFKKGEALPLFADDEPVRQIHLPKKPVERRIVERYCVRDDKNPRLYHCPADFSRMSVGWYLNHAETPNAGHREFKYFALRAIRKGEEVTIDYGTLEEA